MTGRLVVLLSLLSAACTADARVDARRYQLTGVVVSRDGASSRMVIAHEAIEGLMPAMSMPFDVEGASLNDGDRIVATLALSDNRSWLENVRVTGRDGGASADGRVASRATAGALAPDLRLVSQDGTPVTLRDPAGRVLVVTFLYTRCPMPEMCPLMVQHLEAVRRRANDAGMGNRLALLGVTLDPAFDTPAVLRTYGESVLKESNRFDQWTLATGTVAQVEEVARFFGVGYRAEDGFVTHTLTTAVIGRDGRVVRTFGSNSWRADDLFDVVRGAIAGAATH